MSSIKTKFIKELGSDEDPVVLLWFFVRLVLLSCGAFCLMSLRTGIQTGLIGVTLMLLTTVWDLSFLIRRSKRYIGIVKSKALDNQWQPTVFAIFIVKFSELNHSMDSPKLIIVFGVITVAVSCVGHFVYGNKAIVRRSKLQLENKSDELS